VVAVACPTTLVRHPSIRTLGEPSVRGARCILGSVLSRDAAIWAPASRACGFCAVVRTGRIRMLESWATHRLCL